MKTGQKIEKRVWGGCLTGVFKAEKKKKKAKETERKLNSHHEERRRYFAPSTN